MKTIQKVGYAALASALLVESAAAQMNYGSQNVQGGLKGTTETADSAIQTLINRAMLFLALIAVCYGLYGGFLMLTAGGEEDKVSKGKTILFQVALGLVVIFLAWSVVSFVITKILGMA